MSSNWPDKPLIRIIRGNFGDKDVSGGLALMTPAGNYRTGKANVIANDRDDHIDEWEEVTPVPTAALKRLQNAFRGIDVIKSLEPLLLEVLSHLPADKPSALDQVVTDVESIGAQGILETFSTDDRIALLLNAVDNVHTGTSPRYRLALVVRIAYTWADLADPDLDALADIRSCAASLLETGPLEDPSIIPMARSAGLVAERIAHKGLLREALVDLGAYALAWAAEIIAQEETGEGEDR